MTDTARAQNVEINAEDLKVDLIDGRTLIVPISWFPRLQNATSEQRNRWRLIGQGVGIHWEDLDEDLSVKGLLNSTGPPATRARR